MQSLTNKVAIVTGASSGIGRAIALLFASEGAAVVLNARGAESLRAVAEEIRERGGRAHAVTGDVACEETHKALVAAARDVFGGVDIAINNAGTVGPIRPLADVSAEEWQQTLTTNLSSAFLGSRHQIPAMLECGGGSLVFTSSLSAPVSAFPAWAPMQPQRRA